MALVTIGIVTWNSAAHIASCLDAVRAQTHQPLEQYLDEDLIRDAQVIGDVLAREHTSIPRLVDVVRLLPRTLARRRAILRRRVRSSRESAHWFRA